MPARRAAASSSASTAFEASGNPIVRPEGSMTGANPSADPPAPIPTAVVPSTIDPSPSPGTSTLQLPPDGGPVPEDPMDVPYPSGGPSSSRTRAPSPPLPDLKHRPFPPDAGAGAGAGDGDSDSEDEVIATLPVYLSTQLRQDLHTFQYPLHTQARPLVAPHYAVQRGLPITARVKEAVGRYEVEVPVDMREEVWRDDEAGEMGFVAGDSAHGRARGNGHGHGNGYGYGNGYGGEDDDDYVEGGVGYDKRKDKRAMAWGEKMRLRSDLIPNKGGYYSGVVSDGALHLHPITNFYQLRTSLQYLDERDDMAAANRPRGKDDDDADAGSSAAAAAAAAAARKPPPPARGGKGKPEEVKDGSGSLSDFRDKLMSVQYAESMAPWTAYEWMTGLDDEAVGNSYAKMTLSDESKQVRLETTTRALDYLNRV